MSASGRPLSPLMCSVWWGTLQSLHELPRGLPEPNAPPPKLFTTSVPPHVPSCDVPNSVFVGSGLELHCKDKLSVPPATYRWYKDNRALVATADTPYSIDTNKGTLVSRHSDTRPHAETHGCCRVNPNPAFVSSRS